MVVCATFWGRKRRLRTEPGSTTLTVGVAGVGFYSSSMDNVFRYGALERAMMARSRDYNCHTHFRNKTLIIIYKIRPATLALALDLSRTRSVCPRLCFTVCY